MYFPYFRGKQYELLALREVIPTLKESQKIIPIIEPVKTNISALDKMIREYIQNELEFVLISNPRVGRLQANPDILHDKVINGILSDYKKYFVGYIISDKTTPNEIEEFSGKYSGGKLSLIHYHSYGNREELDRIIETSEDIKYNIFIDGYTGHGYRKHFDSCKRIIIKNGFIQRKNADYPEDEFFSDLVSTYSEFKYDGFGDYLVVGEEYSEVGGPAYAIAIHLTYEHSSGDIWIKHFISDPRKVEDAVDPAGKFAEALRKLITFVENNNLSYSSACRKYQELNKREHYPGLGYIKKLSMIHHIELMAKILK